MVEPGITVEDVSLDEYLMDKEKKKLYLDTQAEIAEQKKLIYQSGGVTLEVKHSKRPSKVRHVTKAEYYMKENIKKCKSGPEYVLTILQDGMPQSALTMIEKFETMGLPVGASGVRQSLIKVAKRYPDLLVVTKDRPATYMMWNDATQVEHDDLLNLWRRDVSWEQFVEMYQAIKERLAAAPELDWEPEKITLVDVVEKIDHLTQVLFGMGKERDNLIECNNGLEKRLHQLEGAMEEIWKGGVSGGQRHTLDVNVNFNFGKGG